MSDTHDTTPTPDTTTPRRSFFEMAEELETETIAHENTSVSVPIPTSIPAIAPLTEVATELKIVTPAVVELESLPLPQTETVAVDPESLPLTSQITYPSV